MAGKLTRLELITQAKRLACQKVENVTLEDLAYPTDYWDLMTERDPAAAIREMAYDLLTSGSKAVIT
jgi:hypothetical protein